ncbi:exodeoxyribonuclease VII large subunit [Bacteroides thetaiotaomicron]
MPMDSLSLLELNALVRRSLEQCLPDEYWIQAELSDVRSNTTGHCYLEFVQKDPRSNNLVAKARGMIWSNIYRLLKPYFEETTGQLFTSGIKVLVKVTVQFHELYGYSLTVLDIDPAYTLGDMARRRREILMQLEEEGVLTLNKELEMPVLPQRIAVISSATAAGYGDFCHQLQHNSGGFFFYTELFPALMQGNQVEESVLAALDRINDRVNEFDVVVIIRGGGATSDLSGFDTYLLAAACAQFPLPVITGIGHERDDTVLDSVAHTRVKTPTAAAELLIHRITESADHLEELSARLQQGAYALLEQEGRRLEMIQTRISNLVHRKLTDARFALLAAGKDLAQATQTLLSRHRHRLELLQQRVADASPDKLLSRGYSITLKDGKAVTDAASLNPGDQLVTRLAKGSFTSEVRLDEHYYSS